MSSSKDTGLDLLDQSGSCHLLQALEASLEDLRSVITCRICVRPLYEPYTVACGHSFCFSCLKQWFERDPRKKTCPDCRAEVTHEPAPSYLLRDITQIFISRAELVPPGETTEEHRAFQEEEANIVDENRAIGTTTGKGLFGVRFRDAGPRNITVIRDVDDGVDRCPRCTWELEDGWCEACGIGIAEGHSEIGTSDSDVSYGADSEIGDDYAAQHLMGDDMSLYSVDDEAVDPDAYQAHGRTRERGERPQIFAAATHGQRQRRRRANDDEYDEDFPVMEQYSSDDTAGSLIDFIADDGNERVPFANSPSSSHYDTGPETEADIEPHSDSEREDSSPYNSGLDRPEEEAESFTDMQSALDGNTEDESIPIEGSDEDAQILAIHERLHNRRNAAQSNRPIFRSGRSRPRQPNSRFRGTMYHGRPQHAPIEIGSDSDVPVPIPRSRRSRQIADSDSSDEEASSSSSIRNGSSSSTVQGSPWTGALTVEDNDPISRDPSPSVLDSGPENAAYKGSNHPPRSTPSSCSYQPIPCISNAINHLNANASNSDPQRPHAAHSYLSAASSWSSESDGARTNAQEERRRIKQQRRQRNRVASHRISKRAHATPSSVF